VSGTGFRVRMAMLSAALGAAIMVIAARAAGSDPADLLAVRLGLGNGIVLGALLGGLVGLRLAMGRLPRVASFAGWVVAIALGALLWSIGRQIVWVLDVVLEAVFGPPAAGIGPFIGFGILLAVVRASGRSLSAGAQGLVATRYPPRGTSSGGRNAPPG